MVDFKVDENNLEIVNMVVKYKFPFRIDLEKLSISYDDEFDVSYDPDSFCGASVKIVNDNKIHTVLIFSSGSVIITGIKGVDEALSIIKKLGDKLNQKGVIISS